PNQVATRDATQTIPASTPPSQPYWLRKEGTPGLAQVDDPSLIGRPENPPALPVEYVFEVGGQTLGFAGGPSPVTANRSSTAGRLDASPPAPRGSPSGADPSAPGAAAPAIVGPTPPRARAGAVHLTAPAGGTVTPVSQPFHLAAAGEHARFVFMVTAPGQPATARLEASVSRNGARFDNQRAHPHYDPLPFPPPPPPPL